MVTRGTIIAALLVVELAIIGEGVVAIRGSQPAAMAERPGGRMLSGAQLAEGGAHRIFEAGAHPALSVDIGYADLTIVTRNAAQIDVSVSPSSAYGFFRAKAPIAAVADGDTIRIATTQGRGWSVGDDRMVTAFVPPQTQVTVVNAGDIRANGLRAEASFQSIGQGSITVDNFDASALQVASSGRITLHDVAAARLDATSTNSRVEGSALQVRDGSVESEGRVRLGFVRGADTLVRADTNDGKVRVSGFTMTPSIDTAHGDSEDGAASAHVRIGAGNGRLDVHSKDGSIDLIQETSGQ